MKSTSLTVLVLVLALFGTLACGGGGSVGTDAGETDDATSDAVGEPNASILTLTIEGTEDEMGVMAQGGYEIATGAEEAVIVLVEEDQEQLPLYELSLSARSHYGGRSLENQGRPPRHSHGHQTYGDERGV